MALRWLASIRQRWSLLVEVIGSPRFVPEGVGRDPRVTLRLRRASTGPGYWIVLLPGLRRDGDLWSGDRRKCGEPLPGQGERACPGPGVFDPQPAAARVFGESGRQVVEAEAHGGGFGVGEVVLV